MCMENTKHAKVTKVPSDGDANSKTIYTTATVHL